MGLQCRLVALECVLQLTYWPAKSCFACPSPICPCSRAVAPAAELLQIRPMPRGSLASLASQTVDATAAAARLKPHELLVAVKAVGINFR